MRWVKLDDYSYIPECMDKELESYISDHVHDNVNIPIDWMNWIGYNMFREGAEYWLEVYWRIHRKMNTDDKQPQA